MGGAPASALVTETDISQRGGQDEEWVAIVTDTQVAWYVGR
mgnify:CR=1 FL=1